MTSLPSPTNHVDAPSHLALFGRLGDWYPWWWRPATHATRRYDSHRKASSAFQPRILRRLDWSLLLSSNPLFLTPSLSGIPFAEPPVDGLRFSPPKPKFSLSPLRSFNASNFGKPCLQPVSPLVARSFFQEPMFLSTAIGCAYVRGLSHTQRIQTFRY